MRKLSTGMLAAIGLGACGAATASDFNPVGFYIGAGIGDSNVRNNGYYSGNYYGFRNRNTAWQLTVGMRPISPLALEVDYIDFGSPNGNVGLFSSNGNADMTATAVFAVGYLPMPIPFFDVFAKIGAARLQSDTTVVGPNGPFRVSYTDTDLAYGGGVQWKFSSIAVRAEYERVNDTNGNPDMLAVGVIWKF